MNINIKGKEENLEFPNPIIGNTPTIYIGKIELKDNSLSQLNLQTNRILYIFGALVKTGEVHFQFGELKRNEFIVIEQNLTNNEIIKRHLAQFNSVFYKQEYEKNGGVDVDMLQKKNILYLENPPKWKSSEASIPKEGDQLFYFSKQFYIPANKVSRQYIGCGETIYVFIHGAENDQLYVQFFCQDTSEQTAEDHYKLESLMSDFENDYKDLGKVEELIKQGDKYFHEYILNHKKSNRDILLILIKYVKTKKMKTEIEKKLI